MDVLYIVVPCYNEEEVLPETATRLRTKLRELISSGLISADSRVLLVNDGSSDATWELIRSMNKADKHFTGISLSRNRGHQNALLAGIMTAREHADMVISMDADLQDDIGAVDQMIKKYYEGCDIVYGVRSSRETDTKFKSGTAEGYYKIINRLGGELVYNHADYRLMSRRAVDALDGYTEVNLFLRGIIPMIGYKTAVVEYERGERFAGESKYPFKKMLAFAIEGLTSLTVQPLRAITLLGGVTVFASLVLLIIFIVGACFGSGMLNWKIITFFILFTGGLTIGCIGIVGEYVGKIYMETKKRPRYFIESNLADDNGEDHD